MWPLPAALTGAPGTNTYLGFLSSRIYHFFTPGLPAFSLKSEYILNISNSGHNNEIIVIYIEFLSFWDSYFHQKCAFPDQSH